MSPFWDKVLAFLIGLVGGAAVIAILNWWWCRHGDHVEGRCVCCGKPYCISCGVSIGATL